jgi:hypothetical protein
VEQGEALMVYAAIGRSVILAVAKRRCLSVFWFFGLVVSATESRKRRRSERVAVLLGDRSSDLCVGAWTKPYFQRPASERHPCAARSAP